MQTDKFEVGVADPQRVRAFTQAILRDLRALEDMIDAGMFESDVRRVGVEQEMVLVDQAWRPLPRAMVVLERLDDERFTTELGRFNLEMNLDPLALEGDCLRQLEADLEAGVDKVRRAAGEIDARVVLTGILPTLRQSDLGLDNMCPIERYRVLNEALLGSRQAEFELHVRGTDELDVKHDSVMLEACNTSCQFHLQVSPESFARLYNVAQLVTAPLLAVSCNSPILFGKRLWRETRIAVFEQSIDTRQAGRHVEERRARVSFGNEWVRESILEIFRDDVARFRAFFGVPVDEDPLELLEAGRVPRLRALAVHNGTVYRWNRPCFGVRNGKPHLRIESRILPAGPTILDEVANAAFWIGLMAGVPLEHEDVTTLISFDDAKTNFVAAARRGLDAHVTWLDGRRHAVDRLILDTLLPVARRGLTACDIDEADIDRYLGVIERRAATQSTGAIWQLRSFAAMKDEGTRFERLRALVAAMAKREAAKAPVHDWSPAEISEAGGWRHNYERVGQYMTTDLFTVHVNEVIDLVANVMAWRRIRHVPVEDENHRLVGMVSSRVLLSFVAKELARGVPRPVAVREVMEDDPVTVTPETGTLDAISLMREKGVSCLPVVKDGRLVGIVSEHDFMTIAANVLRDEEQPG